MRRESAEALRDALIADLANGTPSSRRRRLDEEGGDVTPRFERFGTPDPGPVRLVRSWRAPDRLQVGRGRRPSLGITAGKREGDYRLSVRVASRAAARSPYVQRIVEAASGEVRVRVVGLPSAHRAPQTYRATGPYAARHRPVRAGYSIAHEASTAGTLTAFVLFGDEHQPHLLGSNHVFVVPGSTGRRALQPGPLDGGGADDAVGEVRDPVPLRADDPNTVDAALCNPYSEVDIDPSHPSAAAGSPLHAEQPELGARVTKVGRTSGETTGVVDEVGVVVFDVAYPGARTATLVDQVVIEGSRVRYSAPGDSGAMVLTSGGAAVAMLNGGYGNGDAFASPMPVVLATIGARFA